nr:MAG TPA: hypothetical protein [Caudoviricetes sp.]
MYRATSQYLSGKYFDNFFAVCYTADGGRGKI